jgi:hypothetical protein
MCTNQHNIQRAKAPQADGPLQDRLNSGFSEYFHTNTHHISERGFRK